MTEGTAAGSGRAALDDGGARRLITSDLTGTLFVEASAGSGKTTQLVARILELVLSSAARIDQVAAITFTEAAAAELRDRIAEGLERAAAGLDPATGQRRRAAADALLGLDGAAITTLHGFARRILAEHPFAAGLPPLFEVNDEVRSVVAFDERWNAAVDELLADRDDTRALQRLLACGGSLHRLRPLARALDENWDLLRPTAPVPTPPPVDPGPVVHALTAATDMADACVDPDDALLGHLRGVVEPFTERLRAGMVAGELEVVRILAARTKLTAGNRGKAAAWGGHKPDVVSLLAEASSARDGLVRGTAGEALARLGVALGRLTLGAARTRRLQGKLGYHDLLVLARDLVRDRHDVRAALHDQYRFLLIDEYQDTDPIQAELAVRIATPPGGKDAEWHSLLPEPGRLFFVGDPTQSIYRFRRADIGLFSTTKAQLPVRSVRLTTNFRSVPGVVEWVNAAFGLLIGDGDEGVQPAYVRSHAARRPHERAGDIPAVSVLGHDRPTAGSADEARRREGREVAAIVVTACHQGWPVGPEGRPATPADVTILVPTRRSVPTLTEALDDAAVPYRLESSSLVYSAPEVHDLLAVLRAVDDPTDEPSVVAALRSPGFGCADDDLLRYRLAGGVWDCRADPPSAVPADDPVASGLGELRVLHEARHWVGVSELVERVVEERRFLPASLDGPRWRESWRRLRFVVDQARQFAEAFPDDLRRFLRWIDLQAAEDARVTEVVLPESDLDAVRIMTIHAAKGLEFPIVVLAGIGGDRGNGQAPPVLFGAQGPELALTKELRTTGYTVLEERERALDTYEQLRLLYVAATRACDHLVVSVHRSERARLSLAARLDARLGEVDASLWADCTSPDGPPAVLRAGDASGGPAGRGGGPDVEAPPGDGSGRASHASASATGFGRPGRGAPPGDDTASGRARWAAARQRRLGAAPRAIRATDVAKLAKVPGAGAPAEEAWDPDDAADDDQRPAWRRGRAGTAVGRAVHAVLQSVDLVTGRDLGNLARAHADAEGIPTRAGEVAELATAALASETLRAAVRCGRLWRELYVGVPVGQRILEGYVDLLVDGPAGLEVVDYKTDQAAGGDDGNDQLPRGYRLQGAAYSLAVAAATGRPVARCTFLFLRLDGAVAREVADLGGAMDEVRDLLGG